MSAMNEINDMDISDNNGDCSSEVTTTLSTLTNIENINNYNNTNKSNKQNIPQFGNYRNYYKFRQINESNNDIRTKDFLLEWFNNKRVLDIGCNEGKFTLLLAKDFHPKYIEGIDIDKRLIDSGLSAIKRNIYDYKINKKTNNTNDTNTKQFSSSYGLLPRAIVLSNNHLPVKTNPIDNNYDDETKFPFNITFKYMNFLDMNVNECGLYDTITCMSVVKWIHLNNGDEVLLQFFQKLYDFLSPNGRLILEYQPWKSYNNNKNINSHIKSIFSSIIIKPDQFLDILTNKIGFNFITQLGAKTLDECKGFHRPILVLQKPCLNKRKVDSSSNMIDFSMYKKPRIDL